MSQLCDKLAYISFLRVLTAMNINFVFKSPYLTCFLRFLLFQLSKIDCGGQIFGLNLFKEEYLKIYPFYLLVVWHDDLYSNRVDFNRCIMAITYPSFELISDYGSQYSNKCNFFRKLLWIVAKFCKVPIKSIASIKRSRL